MTPVTRCPNTRPPPIPSLNQGFTIKITAVITNPTSINVSKHVTCIISAACFSQISSMDDNSAYLAMSTTPTLHLDTTRQLA